MNDEIFLQESALSHYYRAKCDLFPPNHISTVQKIGR